MSQEITWGNHGWICPRCGRGVAPWMPECSCYREPQAYSNSSSGTYPQLWSNEQIISDKEKKIYETMVNPKINYTHQDTGTHTEGNIGNLS